MAGSAFALSAIGGLGMAAPAEATESGSADEAISRTVEVVTNLSSCKSMDISCIQKITGLFKEKGFSIQDLSAQIRDLSLEIERNHQEVLAAFDEQIERLNEHITEGNNQDLRDKLESLRADLNLARTGTTIYQALLNCTAIAVETGNDGSGVCESFDVYGLSRGIAPANDTTINSLKADLAVLGAGDQERGLTGWVLNPTDVVERIGGTGQNPYQANSVLGAELTAMKSETLSDEHASAAGKISYMPASFVNGLDRQVRNVIAEEQQYFAVRSATTALRDAQGSADDAKSLEQLALAGRGGTHPLLSLADQYKTYSFGTSLESPRSGRISDNEAFLATGDRTYRLALLAAADSKAHGENLPSQELLREMNEAIRSTKTDYSHLAAQYPQSMPPAVKASTWEASLACHKRTSADLPEAGVWFTSGGEIWPSDAPVPFAIYDDEVDVDVQYKENVGGCNGETTDDMKGRVRAASDGYSTTPMWNSWGFFGGTSVKQYQGASMQVLEQDPHGALQSLDQQ